MWNVDKTSFEIYLINSFLIFNYCIQFQVLHLTFTYVYRGEGGVRYPICKVRMLKYLLTITKRIYERPKPKQSNINLKVFITLFCTHLYPPKSFKIKI